MWTEQEIKHLQSQGKIRGYTPLPAKKKGERKKHLQKKGKQHYWIEMNLQYLANEYGLELVSEFKFHNKRHWRLDWAFPGLKLGLEYRGGIYMPISGHSNYEGQRRDDEKGRQASLLGWTILTYNHSDYKNMIQDIREYLKNKG